MRVIKESLMIFITLYIITIFIFVLVTFINVSILNIEYLDYKDSYIEYLKISGLINIVATILLISFKNK